MAHELHTESTREHVLSASCPDCRQKLLSQLDATYLSSACGIDFAELRAVMDTYPQLLPLFNSTPAIEVQKEYLETLSRNVFARGLAKAKYDAMMAPLPTYPAPEQATKEAPID